MDHEIISLRDRPELKELAAVWFHEKWGVPLKRYRDSMDACLSGDGAVPQWYMVVENSRIICGMGVIENDFHNRKDLSPNVCAVYTEKDRRGRGIAGTVAKLDYVCKDMSSMGIDTLYLLTDHTSFYERYNESPSVSFRGTVSPQCRECISTEHGRKGDKHEAYTCDRG